MNIKLKLIFVLLFCSFILSANPSLFREAEELRESGDRQGAFDLLSEGLKSAGSGREKAEFYWRMGETYLNMGDDLEDKGQDDRRLACYEQGEEYADMAIAADPSNHVSYYIKSANIGRWGQTKGILSSLFKADDMRDALILGVRKKDDYADAWNVLSMLYAQVPGRPLSFGNISYSISLSRKAYDSRLSEIRKGEEEDLGVGIRKEFALHLWDRDWSELKRNREQNKIKRKYNSASDVFEKNLFYEGVADIPDMDDREEAVVIMRDLIKFLEDKRNRTFDEEQDLQEVKEILADWL